ncbi:glycosyltransferase family 4 protein [Chitinispirillales bacterium ANBcel5]|uniref:glycosyltransferase family 4 protein n=1 Tax=Cellulosispirillum alkaliphilum TaxID=3039283 RepID=UPI002A553E25|nr:glycosyltransferase family 4 protein [Chitinispirillales bacterium ANBcel5]
MKRLLITTDTVGGVWSYTVELVSALHKLGFEIALASMGKKLNRAQRSEISGLSNLQLFESRYKLEWMNDPWSDVDQTKEWLSSIAEFIAPDIVHLNGFSYGSVKWNIPSLIVAHSCVYSWYRAVKNKDPESEQWSQYKESVSRGLEGVDYIVAPSKDMLDSLSSNYKVSFRGKVIFNGRNRHLFVPKIKDPYILTAGRLWDEGKNIRTLASIAHRLPWQVLVAGEGIDEISKGDVHWLGRCTPFEVGQWMGSASIYVLPARYEPFGLSVLEAALCECALVLGNIASLREVWGDSAFFVDPEDGEQLQDTLQMLIHKPWIRREYGERARQRALQFSVSRMVYSYLDLYQELIDRNKFNSNHREKTLCA